MESAILVFPARFANIAEQARDGLFGYSGYALSSTNGISVNQTPNNLRTLGCSQPIHASIMLERSSIMQQEFWVARETFDLKFWQDQIFPVGDLPLGLR